MENLIKGVSHQKNKDKCSWFYDQWGFVLLSWVRRRWEALPLTVRLLFWSVLPVCAGLGWRTVWALTGVCCEEVWSVSGSTAAAASCETSRASFSPNTRLFSDQQRQQTQSCCQGDYLRINTTCTLTDTAPPHTHTHTHISITTCSAAAEVIIKGQLYHLSASCSCFPCRTLQLWCDLF